MKNRLFHLPPYLDALLSVIIERIMPVIAIFFSFLIAGVPIGSWFPGGFTPDFPAICLFLLFFARARKLNLFIFLLMSLYRDWFFGVYLFANTLFYLVFIMIVFNVIRYHLVSREDYLSLWVSFAGLYAPALPATHFILEFITVSDISSEAMLLRIFGTALVYPLYFALLFRILPLSETRKRLR
jgi:hypothetical protein